MASRAEVTAFQRSNRDLTVIVGREVDDFWGTIDTTTPESARRALDRYLPQLIAAYGDTAALLAADFYDALRADAPTTSTYRAVMAGVVEPETVQRANRSAVGPLATADAVQALANVRQRAARMVLQVGRSTIVENVAADPGRPRFARVPTGAETCAFCLMLASRGAVYWSKRSAGRMNDYHADCDCAPTPMWSGQPYPEGYDPDALYSQYSAARAAAGSGSTKAVLAELRSRDGLA